MTERPTTPPEIVPLLPTANMAAENVMILPMNSSLTANHLQGGSFRMRDCGLPLLANNPHYNPTYQDNGKEEESIFVPV